MATYCCMQSDAATGRDAGSPRHRHAISEQLQVLGDEVRDQPEALFRLPLCVARHQQLSASFVGLRYAQRDDAPHSRSDGCAFDQQFDGCVADFSIIAQAMADADQLVSVAAQESFGPVLIRRIPLRDAQPSDRRVVVLRRVLLAGRRHLGCAGGAWLCVAVREAELGIQPRIAAHSV